MSVCCDCCVLSVRGLCEELITRPEELYRLWCVVVCDLDTSSMRKPLPALGRRVTGGEDKDVFMAVMIAVNKSNLLRVLAEQTTNYVISKRLTIAVV